MRQWGNTEKFYFQRIYLYIYIKKDYYVYVCVINIVKCHSKAKEMIRSAWLSSKAPPPSSSRFFFSTDPYFLCVSLVLFFVRPSKRVVVSNKSQRRRRRKINLTPPPAHTHTHTQNFKGERSNGNRRLSKKGSLEMKGTNWKAPSLWCFWIVWSLKRKNTPDDFFPDGTVNGPDLFHQKRKKKLFFIAISIKFKIEKIDALTINPSSWSTLQNLLKNTWNKRIKDNLQRILEISLNPTLGLAPVNVIRREPASKDTLIRPKGLSVAIWRTWRPSVQPFYMDDGYKSGRGHPSSKSWQR